MRLTQKQSTLSVDEVRDSMRLVPNWTQCDHSIIREFSFKDFRQAIDFVNRVAEVAETENHHPDISISYSKVKLDLSTHSAGGLTSKDFELATKVDLLVQR
jgi:4a-hydroxytetrahydrobiopterin dehydratase